LSEKHKLNLTPSRMEIAAGFYVNRIMDIGKVIEKIKFFSDEVKKMELDFYKKHDINIVMEDDAMDYLIEQLADNDVKPESLSKMLSADFELGLKLVREKTGKNRFFITRNALMAPEAYISDLIKEALSVKTASHSL